jgi:uncharacterized protein DUF6152
VNGLAPTADRIGSEQQHSQELKPMRTKLSVAAAGACLLLSGAQVWAHHAFSAEFDADKPVKLHGTVVKMEWINPHSWIYLQVKDPSGKVVDWAIETGAPNAMFRRGFTKNSLPPGVEVVVEGFQSKDGAMRANGRNVTLPDGRILFVGSSGTGAPQDRQDPADKK